MQTSGPDGVSTDFEHDAQAEEEDLLTIREASVRLRFELETLRKRAATLERSIADPAATKKLSEWRTRIALLEKAIARFPVGR